MSFVIKRISPAVHRSPRSQPLVFICELQGRASSEWNDLLTGTPPSTHTHTCALYLSISRTHANRINPCCINTHSSASHTAPQQEHLPLLRLLICDLVKDIFPHQTLLLLILHISNRKPGLQVACASTPVMPTDGILSGHHTGCCSMCLFKFPGGCYVYVPLQAEFQFHYYAH